MSTISDALKKTKKPVLLLDLDFEGWKKRFTTQAGGISVPYSGYDSLFYDGLIQEIDDISQSFDLESMRYSFNSVSVTLINKIRFQDNEARHRMEKGIGTIRIWTDGLDWSDIEDYPIFKGLFSKTDHNKYQYEFTLNDPFEYGLESIPKQTINSDTWSGHRTDEGGGGSVAGLSQPIVFGNWTKAVPLLCVDTAGFKYLVGLGVSKSSDADYTATTVNVYDLNGDVVGAANYTFYPGGLDEQGNVVFYFDFTADQTASEPLTCSIEALTDGSGEFTGTAGDLIEHPSDIIYYLLHYHRSDPANISLNIESIKTMRSILSGYSFASIINEITPLSDFVDRIMSQCVCARIQRWGKLGVMTFNVSGSSITRQYKFDFTGEDILISRTPNDMVCNDLKVFYSPNPSTGQWEGELIKDRTNNPTCKSSYYQYGKRPQKLIYLTDVRSESMAHACANRYLDIWAFRHDIGECLVPIWKGFDVVEGDIGSLTIEEGSSQDGNGWSDEDFILLERSFEQNQVRQKWWRIST